GTISKTHRVTVFSENERPMADRNGRSGKIISLMEVNPRSPIEIGQSKRAELNERLL
ncbi:hypothetical protein K0M31_010974, partial [Melipona bicolor]